MQTEGLLKQSQQLASELQTQQKELQQTNEQLEQKAQQLAEQNVEVERKNQEIEQARRALEEKAARAGADLEIQVRVPGQHVARAAHAAQQHPDPGPAARRQSGGQSDRRAGRVRPHHPRRRHRPAEPDQRHPGPVEDRIRHGDASRPRRSSSATCATRSTRPFRHEAESREPVLRRADRSRRWRSITTDSKRLQQVLKNLLSNAFKFTEQGGVQLRITAATQRLERRTIRCSNQAPTVVAFEVTDTGIGIPAEKQQHHLRGVPAGGCQHQPQIRRHRPGPGDQPRTGQPARRRDPAAQPARRRAAPSRSICRWPTPARWPPPRSALSATHPPQRTQRRSGPVDERLVEQVADDRGELRPDDDPCC